MNLERSILLAATAAAAAAARLRDLVATEAAIMAAADADVC